MRIPRIRLSFTFLHLAFSMKPKISTSLIRFCKSRCWYLNFDTRAIFRSSLIFTQKIVASFPWKFTGDLAFERLERKLRDLFLKKKVFISFVFVSLWEKQTVLPTSLQTVQSVTNWVRGCFRCFLISQRLFADSRTFPELSVMAKRRKSL